MLSVLTQRVSSDLPNLKSPGIYTFLNPYSYLAARENPQQLNDFKSIYIDGSSLCWLLRLINIKTTRRSFDMTSLAPYVLGESENKGLSLFIIGGEPGVAESATSCFREEYPKLKISGIRSGYFCSPAERDSTIIDIFNKSPDILIVGMGTPLQEKFLIDLRKMGWNGVGFSCGGFLHQTASKGPTYYPKLINKLNLRWLYRIYDEPKLIKRYAFYYPLFTLKFIKDIYCNREKSKICR